MTEMYTSKYSVLKPITIDYSIPKNPNYLKDNNTDCIKINNAFYKSMYYILEENNNLKCTVKKLENKIKFLENQVKFLESKNNNSYHYSLN